MTGKMRQNDGQDNGRHARQKLSRFADSALGRRGPGAGPNASRSAHRKLRLITAQALDGRTRASQQFNKIVSAVTADLGGADALTEIEKHLITSFARAAILQGHQLARLLSGAAIDSHEYASVTVSMLRSATRLGTGRRSKDVTPSLDQYLKRKSRRGEDDVIDAEAAE